MGRPLNKKYFGNRNVGTTSTATDNKIGGEGIASIDWSTFGSFTGNSNIPVLTIPELPLPTLPGGVRATWTMQFEVDAVSTGAGKTNLAVGDTFGVTSIPGMIAKVTDLTLANAVFSVTTTGASRGAALAVASIPQDSQGITLTKIAGTGTANTFLTDISFRIKESTITITEVGSGYTGAETFTFTKPITTVGTVPAGVIVLTVDTGAVGSSTNQENAIIIRAKTTSGGTVKIGDIQKQTASRHYKIKTADGVATCKLVATTSLAYKQAYLVASSTGGTYYVTKLTAHKALLTTKTGDGLLGGKAIKWTFGAPSATVVQIENT